MSQVLVARVTCPGCQSQFQTSIDQILDVREDPEIKVRVMNGLVNVASCPQCGTGGALNLPFLYHDPDNELALFYMPMETGRDNLERQRLIGNLTSTVMDRLPVEERKGYLLQPQVMITMESLVNKILEVDGVTPEMMEEQKAKADLLQRMIDATSEGTLEAIIKENDAAIDNYLLRMLAMNLEMAQSMRRTDHITKLLSLRTKLMDLSSEGREAKGRGEVLDALRADPTRDTLLKLLVQASDEETRELLVVYGRPLLDYLFFQSLTARIDAAPNEDERERLTALRSEILDIRDRLDEQTRALYEERTTLLRDLLLSDDPATLARRRFQEMDRVFLNLLTTNLEQARSAGENEAVRALEGILNLTMRLMEETLPPELQLFNRLMTTEDEAEIDKLLEENRDLVTEQMVAFMEGAGSDLRQEESEAAADHLASVLQKVQAILARKAIAV